MNWKTVSRIHLGIACLMAASLVAVATLRPGLTMPGSKKLPLMFEPNAGQADQAARFIVRTDSADAFLGPTSAVFVLKSDPRANHHRGSVAHKINSKQALSPTFSMQMRGGNPSATSTGLNELTGIRNYAKVMFSSVYPGIDLVYYGNRRQLEYDFIVAPGANPSSIRLGFSGVESLRISDQGDLLVVVAGREVIQKRPYIYQEVDGKKAPVEGAYALVDKKEVAFRVEGYDKKLALIIDPVLVFSTPGQTPSNLNP